MLHTILMTCFKIIDTWQYMTTKSIEGSGVYCSGSYLGDVTNCSKLLKSSVGMLMISEITFLSTPITVNSSCSIVLSLSSKPNCC